MRRKLIVVSNRGPLSYTTDDRGELVGRRGGGGLATALRGLLTRHDVTWIASALSAEDRTLAGEARTETARDGSPFRLRYVAHDEQAYDRYYNVVANPMLWFVQHYLWELAYTPRIDQAFHVAWDEGYAAVNAAFAAAVLDELDRTPNAAVYFHDYHLYLAPRLVRTAAPEATLMQFVHVPWPQPDYWHILPQRIRFAIHDGVLANDVVGFHSDRWRQNFLDCVRDIVGDTGGVRAITAPISVDAEEFAELAESPEVLAAEREIVARRPEKLVVRVDRTDPSKNIVRGFRAFELYLEAHPEMRRRVGMLALLDPSRQDVPEYAEYVGAVQREARRVNDRFAENGWMPIDMQIEDDLPRSVAAYKQFDALFVNATMDGMNLVAKEAPLVNRRNGVVLLSENTGAFAELGEWALPLNPFDVDAQAAAIHAALTMDERARRERLEALQTHVREHDVHSWIDLQLAALDAVVPATQR
ncbi:MAG TPA: trehalose-6-phosphate synthase [Gaiellaceae bacterium]|jgi:trehalose 6-phosphate synthase|nr:trehalose-6-phosphate synthase [Gaiellaceae bacterium]